MAEDAQPSPTSEIQQPLEVSQGSQEEGNINQNPSQALPPPIPAVPDQPPPNDHQQHADKENRNGLNIARFIVEILTLLVLLWYTIVTQGLWNEADRANTIAKDANKQTRDMARIADRPWVGIYEVVLEKFAPTEKVKIQFALQNSGKTPALEMKRRMKAGYFPHIPEEMPDIPSNVPYVRGMVLMPGQTSGIPFLSDVVLTEEIFNSVIVKKDWTYVVWGQIIYTDRFRGEGETTLCAYYIPEIQMFGPCPRGNNAK